MKLELPPTSAGHAKRRVPARPVVLSEQALQALAAWQTQADAASRLPVSSEFWHEVFRVGHGVCTLIARDIDQGVPVAYEDAEIAAARRWLVCQREEDASDGVGPDPVLATFDHALDNLELLRAPGMVSTMPRQEMRRVTLDTVLPEIRLVRPDLAALEAAVDRAWKAAQHDESDIIDALLDDRSMELTLLAAVDDWQRAKRGGA